MWEEVAAIGWIGCALPEAFGGGDSTLVEAAIIAEEMGRALLPGSFIDTVTGALLLLESAAKCRTGDAAERVLNGAVRIHGAMGLTDECDISLYFRRCLALRYDFGGADLHADALLLGMIR